MPLHWLPGFHTTCFLLPPTNILTSFATFFLVLHLRLSGPVSLLALRHQEHSMLPQYQRVTQGSVKTEGEGPRESAEEQQDLVPIDDGFKMTSDNELDDRTSEGGSDGEQERERLYLALG